MSIIVPPFMTNPDHVAPCPCGNPPDDEIIIFGGVYLRRWFHEPCMSFLKYELGEEEMQELESWLRHRHEAEDS